MKLFWLSVITLLFIFAVVTELNIFLNPDILYLTHAAERLLAGGSYSKDFFETNPPLILILYMPIVFLSKYLSIKILYLMLIYFFSLAWLCLLTCAYLLKKIISNNNGYYYLILTIISFVIFILPGANLGQREYLLLILTLPYLFTAVLRIENKPLPTALLILIGLFAAAGIALKPFFAILPALIELYIIYRKRNLLAFIRIETMIMMLFLISYLWSISYFTPDYLSQILPFVLRVYFVGVKSAWPIYFTKINVLFCFVPVVLYFLIKQDIRYQTLNTVLLLSLIALILAFTVPLTLFTYQILPAFSLAMILSTSLCGPLAIEKMNHPGIQSKIFNANIILVISLLFLITPIMQVYNDYLMYRSVLINQPAKNLFAFFNKHPHSTFTCYSSSSSLIWVEFFTNAKDTGPVSYFWWDRGFVILKNKHSPSSQLQKDRTLINKLITDNLIDKKPRFVFVHDSEGKEFVGRDIDYLAELSEYKPFKSAWKHYHLVNRFSRFNVYELKR